jgi:hypothetical protein
MFCRARAFAVAALLLLISHSAHAQTIWQPTPAPLVTAENAPWFSKGEPVHWNGDLYYPTRAVQHFDAFEMVRTGSFRGIPLYIDPMLEANSVVFVPLSGGLMQPYERQQTSQTLAGYDAIAQAPSAPSRAAAYDPFVEPSPVAVASLRSIAEPMAIGTSGRAVRAPASQVVSTLNPPTGVNGIWVNYAGRRWFLAGKAIDYDAATLAEVGTYHGWSVFTRDGDRSIIYIATTLGRLAPYAAR